MFVELFEQVRVPDSQFFGERTHGVLRESTGDAANGISHGPYARMIEVRFIGSGPVSLSPLPGAPRGRSQGNKSVAITEPCGSSWCGLLNTHRGRRCATGLPAIRIAAVVARPALSIRWRSVCSYLGR